MNARKCHFVAVALLIVASSRFAQSQTPANANEEAAELKWKFATVEEAKALLTQEDAFVKRLSPFDRSARLKTSRGVSKEEHLAFVAECIRPWQDSEREKLSSVLQRAKKRLNEIGLPLPAEVLLIKTTGKEEGQAHYTRGNAIVFPSTKLGSEPGKNVEKLIYHELFHIASRADETMRDELYAVIGFENCGEIEFPKSLLSRKLTNPDAPILQHCIRVTVDGSEQWAVPVIYANQETYDEKRGGEFFQYLTFELLVVQRDPETGKFLNAEDEAPVLVPPGQAQGFMEKIGANTGYIIHPEEILADNFALLGVRESKIRTPRIIERMKDVLAKHR